MAIFFFAELPSLVGVCPISSVNSVLINDSSEMDILQFAELSLKFDVSLKLFSEWLVDGDWSDKVNEFLDVHHSMNWWMNYAQLMGLPWLKNRMQRYLVNWNSGMRSPLISWINPMGKAAEMIVPHNIWNNYPLSHPFDLSHSMEIHELGSKREQRN